MNLDRKHIWLALGKNVMVDGKIIPNPHKTWKDVDPSLPNTKIEVLFPDAKEVEECIVEGNDYADCVDTLVDKMNTSKETYSKIPSRY